jgi:hypothetical protein
MRGLTHFAEALANNPFLMHDSATQRFLMAGQGDDLTIDDAHNVGYTKWSEYLATFTPPRDAEEQIATVGGGGVYARAGVCPAVCTYAYVCLITQVCG